MASNRFKKVLHLRHFAAGLHMDDHGCTWLLNVAHGCSWFHNDGFKMICKHLITYVCKQQLSKQSLHMFSWVFIHRKWFQMYAWYRMVLYASSNTKLSACKKTTQCKKEMLLTYIHVCSRMLTYPYVPLRTPLIPINPPHHPTSRIFTISRCISFFFNSGWILFFTWHVYNCLYMFLDLLL